MSHNNKTVALSYNAQARYFLEAAMLVSNYSEINKACNPIAYNNFETVIVGTHHAFSAELLLKGIIYYHIGNCPRNHEIKDLLIHESCKQLKAKIKDAFRPEIHSSNPKELFEYQLIQYIKTLDVADNYDKKEIVKINEIRVKFEFGSFEYFLELHSNYFVKMRYACEKFPPPLDMNFTSFLNNQLRNELENNLLELK